MAHSVLHFHVCTSDYAVCSGARALATTLRRSSKFQKQKATIVDIFDQTVRKHPDKSAVVFEKQRWTFAQLQEYSYRVANYFSAKGYREGDCVAIILHNRPEYIGLWLGLSRLGIASALINYNLRGEVLKHSLSVADAKAVVLSKELAPAMLEARELLGSSLEYFTLDGMTAELGALDLEEELRRSSSGAPPVRDTKSFNGADPINCVACMQKQGIACQNACIRNEIRS